MMYPIQPVLGIAHALGALAFGVGVVLFIAYAIKTFTHAQLKQWAVGLIIGGIILCLLSVGGAMGMRKGFGDHRGGMMDGKMKKMMEVEYDDEEMTMNDMVMELDDKSGDEFDQAFIEGMIPHHQGAIDMAKLALGSAKHAEIKAMAQAIIDAQQKEIDEMEQWLKSWGYQP